MEGYILYKEEDGDFRYICEVKTSNIFSVQKQLTERGLCIVDMFYVNGTLYYKLENTKSALLDFGE